MNDEIRVKLTITSVSLSAEDVSSLLGIEPDSTQVLGKMNRLGTKPYSQHAWILKDLHEVNGVTTGDQIEGSISQFLDRITSVSPIIRSLSEEHPVEFGLYVFAREIPPVSFSNKQLEAIAALGASLDVDIVLYADDQA
jgi:Domain of unknown function (DUF4279)